jgi:hypothetical protein
MRGLSSHRCLYMLRSDFSFGSNPICTVELLPFLVCFSFFPFVWLVIACFSSSGCELVGWTRVQLHFPNILLLFANVTCPESMHVSMRALFFFLFFCHVSPVHFFFSFESHKCVSITQHKIQSASMHIYMSVPTEVSIVIMCIAIDREIATGSGRCSSAERFSFCLCGALVWLLGASTGCQIESGRVSNDRIA